MNLPARPNLVPTSSHYSMSTTSSLVPLLRDEDGEDVPVRPVARPKRVRLGKDVPLFRGGIGRGLLGGPPLTTIYSMANRYQDAARTEHVPVQERGPVRASSLNGNSIGIPAPMRAKLLKAKTAADAAFDAIEPTTGDGLRAYLDARAKHGETIDECEGWLATHRLTEADIEEAKEAELLAAAQAHCEALNTIRDGLATSRARRGLLRDKNPRKWAGAGAPTRHRPGGMDDTASILGLVPTKPPRPIVYLSAAAKLDKGEDATDINGEHVPAGSDYTVSHNPERLRPVHAAHLENA